MCCVHSLEQVRKAKFFHAGISVKVFLVSVNMLPIRILDSFLGYVTLGLEMFDLLTFILYENFIEVSARLSFYLLV